MSQLTLVYAGTPEFAVPPLEALIAANFRIAAVYTQPDRPAGRGRQLQTSAIKECALRHGLPVEQPQTLRDSDAVSRLASYRPDAMIVVAYGLILPSTILDVPRLGCLNIHGSLLPRWRGAAPIQRALLAGDTQTGISIMRMDVGLDTGPVLETRSLEIGSTDTSASLHPPLAALGARALCEILPGYALGRIAPHAQSEEGATYAQKIRKEEARIDWRQSAAQIDRQVRAFNPWPVAETLWRGQQLRIWQSKPLAESVDAAPGTVVNVAGDIAVATGEGLLVVERLQLAGRKPTSSDEFGRAHSIIGERFHS